MARVREIGQALPSGGTRKCAGGVEAIQTFSYTPGSFAQVAFRNVISDSLGKRLDHDLNITKVLRKIEPISGTYRGSSYSKWYPVGYTTNPSHVSAGIPSIAALTTAAFARSNPSRPVVSLPVFIGELRELPQLVKLAGDNLLKRAASANLSYQFGWKPLLSDLQKLVNFQSVVDKRAQEMKRLFSKGGLKRRISLHQGQKSTKVSSIIESSCSFLIGAVGEITSEERAWATIRWKPTKLPPVITDSFLRKQAIKAAFGIGLSASDIWNLMPWSWLIDWFSTTGDYLSAHTNTVPAAPGNLNLMRYLKTTTRWSIPLPPPGITGGNATISVEAKERFLRGKPTITANLPFLSGRQLSILGSLAVLRLR